MDDGLKQRLVGALVLLALGVVFLPTLFAPEHRRQLDRTTQIPPAPTVSARSIESPQRVENLEAAKPTSQAYQLLPEVEPHSAKEPVKSTSTPVKSSAATSKIAPKTASLVPKAWVVQVYSFSQEASALAMRDQLREQGMASFTRNHKTPKGMVTRVFVGPKVSEDSANKLKRKLDKQYKVDSIVSSFAP